MVNSSSGSSKDVPSSSEADSETPQLQLCGPMTGLNFRDHHVGGPYLRIVHQPQKNFRFRYASEMAGTHGCIMAESHNGRSKERFHPSVELHNYHGPAVIRCRLAQVDRDEDHPHRLLNVDSQDGETLDVEFRLEEGAASLVVFPGLGIVHTAKRNLPLELRKRTKDGSPRGSDPNDMAYFKQKAKDINLNIVRLRFSAHEPATGDMICQPAFSAPIHNLKSPETNELKICRMDKISGSVKGNEEVFILTEKVNKKNIKVRFFEVNKEGVEVWSDFGAFTPSDVHHQYAIVFKTPPYRDVRTTKDIPVWIELRRPQDGRTSERMPFKYKADPMLATRKRKADSSLSSLSSLCSGGSLSGNSISEVLRNLTDALRGIATDEPEYMSTLDLPPSTELISASRDYLQDFDQTPAGPADLGSALYLRDHHGVPSLTPSLEIAAMAPLQGSVDAWEETILSDGFPELIKQGPIANSADCRQMLENFDSDPFKEYIENLNNKVNSFKSSIELTYPESEIRFSHLNATKTDAARKLNAGDKLKAQQDKEPCLVSYFEMFSRSTPTGPTDLAGSPDSMFLKKEPYTATFDKKDGARVHQLMSHLCTVLNDKTGSDLDADTKDILKRIMALRLSNGDTLMHMLVASGIIATMEFMLQQMHKLSLGRLLNLRNDRGETMLHTAIKCELSKHMGFMVENGCDPMVEDIEGHTALHFAALYSEDCLRELIQAMVLYKRPHYSFDPVDNAHSTPLLLSAKYSRSGCLALLLQAGADPGLRDGHGSSALHVACGGGHADCVRLLLERVDPGEVDSTDGNGNTALQIVCGAGRRTNTDIIAEMLLEHKANPLKRSGGNSCPMTLASEYPELLSLLRKYAADDAVEIKSEPEEESSSAEDSSDEDFNYIADMTCYGSPLVMDTL